MGQEINGGMWCDSCAKPVMGIRPTHGIRNTLSFLASPVTAGVSLAGVTSDSFICPSCGGPAISMDQRVKRESALFKQRYAGAWWLGRDVLRRKIRIMGSIYIGGLPEYVPGFSQRSGRILVFDRDGISFDGAQASFVIRWHLIRSIVIEDAKTSSDSLVESFNANRSRLSHSPRTAILVQTTEAERIVFVTTQVRPRRVQAKLSAIIDQLDRNPPSDTAAQEGL